MRQRFSSLRKRFNRDISVASTSGPSAEVHSYTPLPDSTSARNFVTTSSLSISAPPPASVSSSPLPSEGAQLGLHIIFDSGHTPGHVAEVDFVAVHGLNFKGNRHHTWETWTKDGKLWLKDFLPAALRGRPVRVMLFGYNSSPALQSAAIKLDDHARNLLQRLSLKRKDAPQRPLVFISHSLGGLVVKQALVEATLDPSYKPIVEATRLLIFFATPHQGGNYTSVGDVVARIVRAGQLKPRNDLLDALKQHSDDATRRFEQSRHLPDGCLVVSFFEGMPYGPMGIIVEKKSAVLNLPGSREKQVPVNADHSSICKFDSPDDPECQLVLGTIAEELRRFVEAEQLSKINRQCLIDLRVTDPHYDKARIEETKGGLLAEAYRWVLGNPDFQRWRNESDSRLLWVKGDPGKGKTMLICGIIDELKTSATSNTLSFFFCQATDRRINNATAVLRGLIYLLISEQPTLISHVRKKYDRAGKSLFEDTNSRVALSEIFTGILQDPALKTTYLIIDALDECVIDQLKLLELIVRQSSISSRIKWIVSSRNWLEIEEQLEMATQKTRLSLELNAESVAAAVSTYINHKVLHLSDLKNYDSETETAVRDYLSSNADGTFLWVALVCQALADPKVRKRHTLTKLRTFPPGLDDLYARMVEQIGDSEDADLCKQILAVTTIVRRPISLPELTTLIEMPNSISDDLESLEEIIKACGSFLTLREQIVYFVHQSAKDFLHGRADYKASREAFDWLFPRGTEDLHHIIFLRSLNAMSIVLRCDVYGLEAPGFPIDEVQTPSPDPLVTVQYSCVFWVDHLCASIFDKDTPQRNILDAVQSFLKQKYLYWLEALSLLRAVSEGVIAIRQLKGLLGHTDQRQMTTFVRDIYRFALSYRWIIEQAPLQAYTSALVFAPAYSLVKKIFKSEEPDWISTKPVVEANWNACLQTLEGHRGSVCSVAFSADGQRLASGSDDTTVKIWDPTSGRCLQTLKGHSGWICLVAFSADSQRLASGSDDTTVKIWDPTSGRCLQTLEGHLGSVRSVTFLADGQRLISGSDNTVVKIWDPTSGQCLQTLEGYSSWVRSVAFSADGQQLASGSTDCTVKIWDPASGRYLQTLEGHRGSVYSVTFSVDSQQLASGSADCTLKIWDLASGRCLQTLEGHRSSVYSVAFSANSQRLASGSDDRTLKIWDPASGQCLQTLEGHLGSVRSVTFSADGQQLTSGSDDYTVKIWDPTSGRCLQTLEGYRGRDSSEQYLHSGSVRSVAFSVDGQRLASGSDDRTLKIWDPTSGRCLRTLKGHSGSVYSVAFSADSQRLASGSTDCNVKIWDPVWGQCLQTLEGYRGRDSSEQYLQTLEGHSGSVYSVAFSADGQRLASGSADRTLKIWDPASGRYLQTLKGHSGSVYSAAFSADGQRLASGSADRTLKIWDPASGRYLQTLEGHSGSVRSVAFSADSQRLASGSDDRTLKIWDPASGQCLQTLKGHHSSVNSVVFSLDNSGQYGYCLGEDQTWIICNDRNMLWLPPDYRSNCSAVQGRMVSVGCRSGRVFTIGFSHDI